MFNKEMVFAITKAIISLDITPATNRWQIEDLVNDSPDPIFNNSKVNQGVTKRCISFPQYKVVVKYSKNGYTEAEREIQIYQEAKKAGIAFLFPQTEELVKYNGITFVIQEMVDYSCGDTPIEHEKIYENISRTVKTVYVKKMQAQFDKAKKGYHRTLNITWAKCVISLYGKNVAKTLSLFVKEQGINDLHYQNIGYINRKPVILDFSGYDGN